MGELEDQLIRAAALGQLKIVKELVERGADIHAEDDIRCKDAALRFAGQQGHEAIVRFLTEKGGDVHIYYDHVLLGAAEGGHEAVVLFLIEKGMSISSLNLALLCAERRGHEAVVKTLILSGADAARLDKNYANMLIDTAIRRLIYTLKFNQQIPISWDEIDFLKQKLQGLSKTQKIQAIERAVRIAERNNACMVIKHRIGLEGDVGNLLTPGVDNAFAESEVKIRDQMSTKDIYARIIVPYFERFRISGIQRAHQQRTPKVGSTTEGREME